MNITKEQLTSPCVYRVLGLKGTVLYVGCGSLSRVLDINTEQKGRAKAFATCVSVAVEFSSTKEQALLAESKLIHELHPKHNAFCPKCGYYAKRRPKRLQGKGIIFGKTKHALLELFLGKPEKGFFVREAARATGISVGTVHRELKFLAQAGILKKARHVYQAESSSPFFRELQSMVLKGA